MPILTQPNHEPGSLLSEGQKEMAKEFGVTQFEAGSIGFNPQTQTWYGWSHRAVAGFKVGDVVKKGDVIAQGIAADTGDGLPGPFPVGFKARTVDDARRMARQYAAEVS